MKVAVCLSGHLRSFHQTYKSLQQNILSQFDCDVFIHTWDVLGVTPHLDGRLVLINTSQISDQIISAYNPKNIRVEKPHRGSGERYRKYLVDNRDPNGVVMMFYKIEACHNMARTFNRRNNYDVFIRCRPDLEFTNKLNHQDLIEAANSDTLFLPEYGHYAGLNDQFAFGNLNVMSTYSAVFSNLDSLISRTEFKPEFLLKEQVLSNNILVKFSDVKYVIRRSNGDIFDNQIHSPGLPNLEK